MKLANKIKELFTYKMDDLKYKESFSANQLITYIGIPVFIFLPYFFQPYFPWIISMRGYLALSISYLFIHVGITLTLHFFNKGSYYPYISYIGLVVYTLLIYLTGGVNSSFIFILSFPIILALAFLDAKLIRNLGLAALILLGSVIFWDKSYQDPALVTKQILNVFGFALLVFYLYRLIKEILFQRYQKEHYKRKFIELSEVDNVKETFITAISHQLRTPLNGAKWAVEAALEDKNNSSQEFLKEGLKKIVDSIKIVGEILKSTELDVGTEFFKLNKEKVALCSIIDNILKNLDFLIKGKDIKLEYNKCEDIYILADRKTLDLGLSNIFDNAFRYSPKGTVTVLIERADKNVKLIVNDTGVGIDSADMEYMFQKFFRGKNAIEIDPNESGVGLYATKKIIEMHDGSIQMSSVLGKGTNVEITLPLVD